MDTFHAGGHPAGDPANDSGEDARARNPAPHFSEDEITRYVLGFGFPHVPGDGTDHPGGGKSPPDLSQFLPEELRRDLGKMLDPKERKQMLSEIYKTRVFVASYWMLGIFAILMLLPEGVFFAPFIAGYVGGRKAGSVWKGTLAAGIPFILLASLYLLVEHRIIYHFYDVYLPPAGMLTTTIAPILADRGLDLSRTGFSGYGSRASLTACCIYMVISAIIGGTLEGDARKMSRETAEWVKVSNISSQFIRRKAP